jgi:hypothetical protein
VLRYKGLLIKFRLSDALLFNTEKIEKGQMSVSETGDDWFHSELDWWFLSQHTSYDLAIRGQSLLESVSFMPTMSVGDASTSFSGDDDPLK